MKATTMKTMMMLLNWARVNGGRREDRRYTNAFHFLNCRLILCRWERGLSGCDWNRLKKTLHAIYLSIINLSRIIFPQSRRDSFIFKISKNPINKETHFGKNLNCPEGSKGVEWEKMVSGLKEYYFGPTCIHYNLHVGEQAGMQFLPNTNQLDLLSTVVKISAIFLLFLCVKKWNIMIQVHLFVGSMLNRVSGISLKL